MMRKPMIVALGTALLLVPMVSVGQAGSGPRLQGSFNVTGSVEGNDIGVPAGTVTTEVYTFKSSCGSGGCPKVTLTRKSASRKIKSTLKKVAPGVYKGSEGPSPYTCVDPLGAPGQFTADHKIKVTKSAGGLATRISGEIKTHITGCTETFENAKVTGKLTR
jgi:hypothetical protein